MKLLWHLCTTCFYVGFCLWKLSKSTNNIWIVNNSRVKFVFLSVSTRLNLPITSNLWNEKCTKNLISPFFLKKSKLFSFELTWKVIKILSTFLIFPISNLSVFLLENEIHLPPQYCNEKLIIKFPAKILHTLFPNIFVQALYERRNSQKK